MFYEEFETGTTLRTRGRTVTETDVVIFATLTGAQNPLFLDAEYAKETPFGSRIVPGLLSVSIAVGLAYQLPQGPFGEGFVALLGLEFKTPKPVRIGDTLSVEVRVLAREPPVKGRGVVVLGITARIHSDTVAVEAVGRFLVRSRAAPGGDPAPASASER